MMLHFFCLLGSVQPFIVREKENKVVILLPDKFFSKTYLLLKNM